MTRQWAVAAAAGFILAAVPAMAGATASGTIAGTDGFSIQVGTVVSVQSSSGSQITVDTHGSQATYAVVNGAPVDMNGVQGSIAQLTAGERVDLTLDNMVASGAQPDVVSIVAHGRALLQGQVRMLGTVAMIDGNAFALVGRGLPMGMMPGRMRGKDHHQGKGMGGILGTIIPGMLFGSWADVTVSTQTVFSEGSQSVSQSNLAVGEKVLVIGTRTGAHAIDASRVEIGVTAVPGAQPGSGS